MTIETNKPVKWFVRRASDNRILCTDGLWRGNVGGVDSIKYYSTDGRAIHDGLQRYTGGTLTAYGLYRGDCVNCYGEIKRKGCDTYA